MVLEDGCWKREVEVEEEEEEDERVKVWEVLFMTRETAEKQQRNSECGFTKTSTSTAAWFWQKTDTVRFSPNQCPGRFKGEELKAESGTLISLREGMPLGYTGMIERQYTKPL
jgi:hypothetical protein